MNLLQTHVALAPVSCTGTERTAHCSLYLTDHIGPRTRLLRMGWSLQHLLLCRPSHGCGRHDQHAAPALCRPADDEAQGRVGGAHLLAGSQVSVRCALSCRAMRCDCVPLAACVHCCVRAESWRRSVDCAWRWRGRGCKGKMSATSSSALAPTTHARHSHRYTPCQVYI